MSEEDYKKIFSQNLNYFMELNEKTQIDIINDLGFNKSAVSTWCNGTRLPRMDKVDALAKYFGIKRSDLIEDRSSKKESGYYMNQETVAMAQQLFENKELRVLFDAARDASPDDLKTAYDILIALKRKERGYTDDTGC